MDGFSQGVDYYNKQKSTDVQVLGWDAAKQDGQFTGDFEDIKGGQRTAQGLISQGADIVFPVAGPAGLGALQAARPAGARSMPSGWTPTAASALETYCSNIITSVNKVMDVAVRTRSRPRRMAHSPMSRTSAPWRMMAPAWRRSTTSSPRFPPS